MKNKKIFIGYNCLYGLSTTSYDYLVIGKEYNGYFGYILPYNYKESLLWGNYANIYNENQFEIFMEFLKQVKIPTTLKIIETTAKFNPMYYEKLFSQGKPSSYEIDIDYTIQDLKNLLDKKSIKINLIIWNLLLTQPSSKAEMYLYAKYSPNNSISRKTADSTLMYYLKNTEWIPDKNGKFFKPQDISINALNEKFIYNKNNIILKI